MKTTIIALTIAATVLAVMPSDANADGPLRRWLRGLRTPKASANCGYAPTTANYAPNQYNLQPGQCMKTCPQTCTRTVVNYVPCTAYRTVSKRVPVTQYRPETTSDPCTGCTVTCMKPCTSYTYQVQRVPYTTYRPVYRQETYKVPVTTITNGCETGTCGTGNVYTNQFAPTGCDTCSSGQALSTQPNYGPVPTPAPQTNTYYESPGTITTGDSYGTGTLTPADRTPTLSNPTSYQRPVTERLNTPVGSGYQASTRPAAVNAQQVASRSPIHQQWSYSPVRLASFEKPVATRSQLAPVAQQARPMAQIPVRNTVVNQLPAKRNGWVEVN